jgi:hypothetical protein
MNELAPQVGLEPTTLRLTAAGCRYSLIYYRFPCCAPQLAFTPLIAVWLFFAVLSVTLDSPHVIPHSLFFPWYIVCITLVPMDERDSPMTFRATPEDRKIIAELRKRLGQTAAGIIRMGLRRLYEEENKRLKE